MPDLDTGHIFLTTLAPIKSSSQPGNSRTSYEQNIRIALAELPKSQQSPATVASGMSSPFSRNMRNHLARMFVLNDVVFNGRDSKNALSAAAQGIKPIIPQKVDRLNAPYLVFCAEIDAITEDGQPLPTDLSPSQQRRVRDAYARELWNTMEEELRDIYSNCVGFESVATAEQFATYLNKCHVETTMPFHDYYIDLPKFHDLPVAPLVGVIAVPALVTLLAIILRLFGMDQMPLVGWGTGSTMLMGAVFTILGFLGALKYTQNNGNKPLAPAKFDDLHSVLKALYTQQKFADFVADHQGQTPQDLHAAFGNFLDEHKPSDVLQPTQPPGVISSATAIAK